jgi:hypothetical protein
MTVPVDIGAIVRKVTGYLEESPGVKSSTRLIGVGLLALTAITVVVNAWYVVYSVLHKIAPDAAFEGAIAVFAGATCYQGCVAISKRGDGT